MGGRKRQREDDGDSRKEARKARAVKGTFDIEKYKKSDSNLKNFNTNFRKDLESLVSNNTIEYYEFDNQDATSVFATNKNTGRKEKFNLSVSGNANDRTLVYSAHSQNGRTVYVNSIIIKYKDRKMRTPESITKHISYLLLLNNPQHIEVQAELTSDKNNIILAVNTLEKGLRDAIVTEKSWLPFKNDQRNETSFQKINKTELKNLLTDIKTVENTDSETTIDVKGLLYKYMLSESLLNPVEKDFIKEFKNNPALDGFKDSSMSSYLKRNLEYLSGEKKDDQITNIINAEREIFNKANFYLCNGLAERHAETKLPMLKGSKISGTKRPCFCCALYFKLKGTFDLINPHIGRYWNSNSSYISIFDHYKKYHNDIINENKNWWSNNQVGDKLYELAQIPFFMNASEDAEKDAPTESDYDEEHQDPPAKRASNGSKKSKQRKY